MHATQVQLLPPGIDGDGDDRRAKTLADQAGVLARCAASGLSTVLTPWQPFIIRLLIRVVVGCLIGDSSWSRPLHMLRPSAMCCHVMEAMPPPLGCGCTLRTAFFHITLYLTVCPPLQVVLQLLNGNAAAAVGADPAEVLIKLVK